MFLFPACLTARQKCSLYETSKSWLLNNFPRVVTIGQVGKLFGNAYLRAATVETAVNGFRKSGIDPPNRIVFRTHDFAIHAEEEDAISDQSGYELTMFRNNSQLLLIRDSLAIFN
jgi:hypothetical protein